MAALLPVTNTPLALQASLSLSAFPYLWKQFQGINSAEHRQDKSSCLSCSRLALGYEVLGSVGKRRQWASTEYEAKNNQVVTLFSWKLTDVPASWAEPSLEFRMVY